MVYTDGSGYQGYIGAAAVIPSRNVQITECIGTERMSTVYAGEACGIKFALQSLIQLMLVQPIKELVIFLDSQAALQMLQNLWMVSGQEYI
jgi:ribonuclease HI